LSLDIGYSNSANMEITKNLFVTVQSFFYVLMSVAIIFDFFEIQTSHVFSFHGIITAASIVFLIYLFTKAAPYNFNFAGLFLLLFLAGIIILPILNYSVDKLGISKLRYYLYNYQGILVRTSNKTEQTHVVTPGPNGNPMVDEYEDYVYPTIRLNIFPIDQNIISYERELRMTYTYVEKAYFLSWQIAYIKGFKTDKHLNGFKYVVFVISTPILFFLENIVSILPMLILIALVEVILLIISRGKLSIGRLLSKN